MRPVIVPAKPVLQVLLLAKHVLILTIIHPTINVFCVSNRAKIVRNRPLNVCPACQIRIIYIITSAYLVNRLAKHVRAKQLAYHA